MSSDPLSTASSAADNSSSTFSTTFSNLNLTSRTSLTNTVLGPGSSSEKCSPVMMTSSPLHLGLGLQNRFFSGRQSAFQPVSSGPVFGVGQGIPNPTPGLLQIPFNPVLPMPSKTFGFGDLPTYAALFQQLQAEQKNLLLPNPPVFVNQQDFGFPSSLSAVTSADFGLAQHPSPLPRHVDVNSPSTSFSVQLARKSSNLLIQNEPSSTGRLSFSEQPAQIQNSSTSGSNSSSSKHNSYPLDDDIDDPPEALLCDKSKMLVVSAQALTKIYGTKIYQQVAASTPQIEGNIRKSNLRCVVCQDKPATGRHYGVISCFGCKSFWRRSVWNNRKYRCKFNGDCPIRRIHRNICRACRLRKCFQVGMNPLAVQSERESGKDMGDMKQEQSDEDMDSSTSRALSASSLTNHSSVGVPLESCKQTQTEFSTSPNGVVFVDDELTKKAQILVAIHSAVCSRSDELLTSPPDTPSRPPSMSIDLLGGAGPSTPSKPKKPFDSVSFVEAFYNPTILHSRTPLTPIGTRTATVNDVMDDWRRCFVLYSDWLLQLCEFRQLSKDDQISLAKEKFAVFHWWICGLWTAEAKKEGICYSNGSFFPRQTSEHCVPDSNGMTEKILKHFVEPLLTLQLTEVEKCCLFLISLFSDDIALVSAEGKDHIRRFREKFIKVLFNSTVSDFLTTSEIPKDNAFAFQRIHSSAAVRISKIIFLSCSLNSLVNLSANNGKLSDLLPIIDWQIDYNG